MNLIKKIFLFYYNWLKDLTNFGKSLWKLLGVKVIILIIFAYLVFPNILKEKYGDNQVLKGEEVSKNILYK